MYVVDTGVCDTHPEFGGRAQQLVNYAGGENVGSVDFYVVMLRKLLENRVIISKIQ